MDRIETVIMKAALEHGDGPRLYKFEPQPGDIMVAGALKTGTTWLQQILHQIRTRGDESFSDIYDVSWWLPFKFNKFNFDYTQKQPFAPPRILKTHELYEEAPITRFAYLGLQCMLDFFIPSYWPHRNDPNVLWLHYEDLKKDLRYCIERIAEFVNIPLTKQELDRVYSYSTFEYMSKHANKFHGDMITKQIAGYLGEEQWKHEIGMVRKDGGQIGQGATGFSPEILEKFQKSWERIVMPVVGYKSYKEMYEACSLLNERNK